MPWLLRHKAGIAASRVRRDGMAECEAKHGAGDQVIWVPGGKAVTAKCF